METTTTITTTTTTNNNYYYYYYIIIAPTLVMDLAPIDSSQRPSCESSQSPSSVNGGYSLGKLASFTYTMSYTPVLHHICPTFFPASCDPPPPLTCTSLALIFISVHVRFTLQLTVWHSLPSILCSSQTLNTFRKNLKTHLFQSAFNSSIDFSSATLIHSTG